MNSTWIIAKRELGSFFDSLVAYVLVVLFLGFSGFFTWLSTNNVFYFNQASLTVFFRISYWTLFIFIPAITMKLIAEEKKTGTIELLFTKPISDWNIIMGKFIAALLLIVVALVLSLPYYFTVWSLGPVDHGAVLLGYLGLIFMSGVYISIGLFASSITNNQIVAFLLALLIGVFFHILFGVFANGLTGSAGMVFDYLDMNSHMESISRGVLDPADVIYFLSVIFLGLAGTEAVLAK